MRFTLAPHAERQRRYTAINLDVPCSLQLQEPKRSVFTQAQQINRALAGGEDGTPRGLEDHRTRLPAPADR